MSQGNCSSSTADMLFSSTDIPIDYLGARADVERRKAERRTQPRSGPDRRTSDRRRATLRDT